MRTVAERNGRRTRAALDEAAVWEEGARVEFAALLDLLHADPRTETVDEQDVMARLAVVGAALMKSLGARRTAAGAGARRGRRARRST